MSNGAFKIAKDLLDTNLVIFSRHRDELSKAIYDEGNVRACKSEVLKLSNSMSINMLITGRRGLGKRGKNTGGHRSTNNLGTAYAMKMQNTMNSFLLGKKKALST